MLLDADVLVYKAAAVGHSKYPFESEDGTVAEVFCEDTARRVVDAEVNDLANTVKATEILCALTPSGPTFRHELYDRYKAKRPEKPKLHAFVREHILKTYPVAQWPGVEGDDVLGILGTEPDTGEDRIVVSIDKDLETVPCKLFNPMRDRKPRQIGPLQAELFTLWQSIVGDTVDNYPGVPRIGPKSVYAQSILAAESAAEAFEHACDAAASKGYEPEHIILMARLAHILRWGDLNDDGSVNLWQPPD